MSKLKKSLSILLASSSIFASQVGATEVVIPKSKHETRSNVASCILTSLAAGSSFFRTYLADSAVRKVNLEPIGAEETENVKSMFFLGKKYETKLHNTKIRNTHFASGSLLTILGVMRRVLPNRWCRGVMGGANAVASGVSICAYGTGRVTAIDNKKRDMDLISAVAGTAAGISNVPAETIHTVMEQNRLYKAQKENHVVREKAELEKSIKEKQNELEKVNVALKQKEENKKS